MFLTLLNVLTKCSTAKFALIILSLLMSVLSVSAFAGTIYKYRDRKGVVNYTNIKPNGVPAQIIMVYCPACDPKSTVDFSRVPLKPSTYNTEIANAIRQNPVEEALVRAVIQAESAYNPNALSKAGAQGLMQLMPGTARQYGVSNSYDPQQNIYGGTRYLRFLLNMFDGDIKLVSAAYNSGENNVLKYAGVPPFSETQVYVQRVAQLYQRYRVEIANREQKLQAEKLLAAQNAAAAAPKTAAKASSVPSLGTASDVAAAAKLNQ